MPYQMPTLPPGAVSDERTIASVAARAIALAKAGDGRGAIALAKVARAQAQGMELARGELTALNAAAVVHLLRGDAISAVAAAMDAMQMVRRLNERALAADARVTLHFASFNLGARDGVESGLRACVADAVELMDRPLESRARSALGVVYGDGGRFDAASFEFQRALVTARIHGGPTCPARLVANLANLQRKRAVAIEVDALAIAGCVRVLQGRRRVGRALLQEAVAIGHAARSRPAILWVLCELGSLLASELELEAAAAAFTEALDIASQLRPSRKVGQACTGLAEVAARRGDARGADAWRERAAAEDAEYERARHQTREQVDAFLLAA